MKGLQAAPPSIRRTAPGVYTRIRGMHSRPYPNDRNLSPGCRNQNDEDHGIPRDPDNPKFLTTRFSS